jgi:hypothetical protein
MRFHLPSMVLLVGTALPLSAQTAGTYVCTAGDQSRQAGFVSQLFNVSAADAAKVQPAWAARIKQYGVTPSTPPKCERFAKFAAADSARKQFIAFVTNSLEHRIDQMPWTYGGAPAATADAPAALASSQSTGAQGAADAEMSEARGYCVQNHSGMYDCDAYAQALHDHRLAHPDEWQTLQGGQRRIVPIHDLEIGIKYHLDCTSCLRDPMLSSWAREGARAQFSAAVLSKAVTQASVDAYGDCVGKAFVPKMHARPNVDEYQRNFNDAMAECGSPRH